MADERIAQPSVTCPRCHRTSYHPKDIEQGYCGACHDWTSTPAMKHKLKGDTLYTTDAGIVAECICGWKSLPRFSGMIASVLFRDHYLQATGGDYDEDLPTKGSG